MGNMPLYLADMMKEIEVMRLSKDGWFQRKAEINKKGKEPLDLFCFAESQRAGKRAR
jgi:hypothetical protein